MADRVRPLLLEQAGAMSVEPWRGGGRARAAEGSRYWEAAWTRVDLVDRPAELLTGVLGVERRLAHAAEPHDDPAVRRLQPVRARALTSFGS